MTSILSDLSSPSLTAAIKDNLYAFFGGICDASLVSGEGEQVGFRWHTPLAHPWFNGVLISRPPTAGADQVVRDTVAYFRSHGVSAFTWWLAPSLEPGAWSQHLLPHGFQYDDNTPGMAINLAALPSLGQQSTIQVVEDRETLDTWARILVRGFEMPEEMAGVFLAIMESVGKGVPIRHYLGLVDGEPVATSSLFLGSGVAGIYNVATLPAARGKGVGSAMTLIPLHEARDLGYNAGILQSSRMGYGLYRRLGFQKLCQMDHFHWRDPGIRANVPHL